MAIKRVVNTEFWTDEKVIELFSPEDKLFMLYLLTNPHTKQLGIYKLAKKQCAFEIGYSVDAVSVLLDRFENKYNMIKYSSTTSEIAIKNFLVHSVVKGGKPVEDCLIKDIGEVKDKSLLKYVFDNIYNKDNINETVKKIVNTYYDNDNDNEDTSAYRPRIVDIQEPKQVEVVSIDGANNTLDTTDKPIFNKEEYILELFNKIWEKYPRKVNKQLAKKTWTKKFKGLKTQEEILEKARKIGTLFVQNQKQWVQEGRKIQFVPHLSSFLNSNVPDKE